MESPFSTATQPDWEGFISCVKREKTPQRVHNIELFLDGEVQNAICERYGLLDGLDPTDAHFNEKKTIALYRFLGYDYVRCGLEGMDFQSRRALVEDTAELGRAGGRSYVDEITGPITNWEEFETYPWFDAKKATTRALEWYQENLPDDMCIVGGGGFGHFAEGLLWLMGYETLCYALVDERELVRAIADRLIGNYEISIRRILEFDRVKAMWGSDDMGFRTGPLISPDDLREFVLPGHKLMAEISHEAGRPYFLHSCGNLSSIMDDLLDDVKIDAKHSYEDTIEFVTDVKEEYGDRLTILGGIDVDFLCRADEEQIRRRVRETCEKCLPGGGYCLGTGNSVANYIPIDNYLTMLDEGHRFEP
jgi:uroporphyrinogen decarboxylase